MNRMFKRHSKGEKGFTLVELLIVFTLLAVLAGIMIPNVAGFVQFGQTQSAAAELSIIQTAMDSMMAKDNVTSITAANATTDWSAAPSGHALYPNYLRFQNSNGSYNFDSTGLVSTNTTGF
jgi:prepilin-type N-terminal cleavage/methylation domain-containing protein